MLMYELDYLPRGPVHYRPPLGLIGCGGITFHHLTAYRAAGYQVVALCDVDRARAEARRREFYPKADVYDDHHRLLQRPDIEVVDIATHPAVRGQLIEDALHAGKHVLSQKPFVTDLDQGLRLAELADQVQRRLAVNQNGRWAPHFSYLRQAVATGLLGELSSVEMSIHWDHTWVAGTPFDQVHHLVLYDYAIHWFDMIHCLMGQHSARRVFASLVAAHEQPVHPPLLARVIIQFDHAIAGLSFNAWTRAGRNDRTFVVGSAGTFVSTGPNEKIQSVTLHTRQGSWSPTLQGCWFPDGFHGTMGELLLSIEQQRRPSIDCRDALHGLALCFAAVQSAETGLPITPGSVRKLL
jgi:predicted dehydrogenase